MIFLSIKGRLGNQMFQYAFARALKEKLNQEIVIDWHFVDEMDKVYPNIGFEDSLKQFNVTKYQSINSINYRKVMTPLQYYSFLMYERSFPFKGSLEEKQAYENTFLKTYKNRGLLYCENGYYDFKLSRLPKNIFLSGYYESERYFKSIKDIIKNEFTPRNEKLKHNISLYKQIEKSESVCVTIRTGYKKNSLHSVCDIDYFLKGMDYFAHKISNAKFFVFSNDIKWIKENVRFKYPVVFEEGNNPVWEKLRLMYSCKHFIISNSTFSWWAQYLSNNKSKMVVVPDRWYNSSVKSDLLNNDGFIIL